MKKLILVFSLCLTGGMGIAQEYPSLINQADSLYKIKAYKPSLQYYEQAFKLEKKNYLHLYDAACSAALAGDQPKALQLLNLAVDNGWSNTGQYEHLQKDPDLTVLHGQKGWQELLDKTHQKALQMEAFYEPVKEELLQILKDDQEPKVAFHATQNQHKRDSIKKVGVELERKNLIKIKAILDKYGWLSAQKVGPQANSAIFLVIQHAEQATQEQYLPMMQQAVRQGNARPSDLALLEDRVALGQGKKQTYGSQIGTHKKTGKPCVLPLEDPEHVDQRRQAVGLMPLAEYVKQWGITWDVEEYKKQGD
jgi:tetratricopeptide (TPR) repeat protein